MSEKRNFDTIHSNKKSSFILAAKKEFLTPCSSPKKFGKSVMEFMPILSWLPKYNFKQDLFADIVGGITNGVMHVPQGIAYAILAGVKPIDGLYMSFFATLFYMLFGTSKHMSLGSFAVVALMTGVTNEAIMSTNYPNNFTEIYSLENYSIFPINPISITMTLTFTVGICEIAAAVLRLGFLTSYFSDPLIAGFTTGAAVHVLVSQLDDVLGVKLTRVSGPGYLFVVIYRLILKIPECNFWTLGASASGGLFLIFGKDYLNPLIYKITGKKIVVPYELLVMIISTAISHILSLNGNHNVPVVGTVPAGLPKPQLPNFLLIPECFSTAVAIAIISIALDISLSKMIAKKLDYKIDPGQEIYALGFVSTLASFFPVFPISTALGRTMVQVESGVRSQLAALFSALFLLAVILFLGPYFETLPLCILSTVILVAIRPMFKKFSDLPRLWKISKYDFATWIVSFGATVCIDVIGGLATAVVFTIMTVVIRTQLPYWESKISSPSWSTSTRNFVNGICIFKFESFLLFTNVERFKSAAQKTLNNWTWQMPNLVQNEKINYFIFDCSSITQIDSMGLRAIQEIVDDIQQQTNATIYFASVQHHIKDLLIETKILENKDCFWNSVDELLKFMKVDTVRNNHVNNIIVAF